MFNDFEDPPFWRWWPSAPKKVKGGIKAQAKKFGNQWWATRWLEAIEKFGPQRRVARGRSYARKGQVLELNFNPGRISATVQGSRETPYRVEIFLQQLPAEIESTILRELQTQPIYAATLLTGEVHPEIERVFGKYNFSLFPTKEEGRAAVCSCPDIGNPCKHIAAVYYLISNELERDPFLLLHMRGITREKLFPVEPKIFPRSIFHSALPAELPVDPQQFWKTPRVTEIPVTASAALTRTSKPPILQRLGSFPLWRGESNFVETLERIYKAAGEKELKVKG